MPPPSETGVVVSGEPEARGSEMVVCEHRRMLARLVAGGAPGPAWGGGVRRGRTAGAQVRPQRFCCEVPAVLRIGDGREGPDAPRPHRDASGAAARRAAGTRRDGAGGPTAAVTARTAGESAVHGHGPRRLRREAGEAPSRRLRLDGPARGLCGGTVPPEEQAAWLGRPDAPVRRCRTPDT